METVVLAASLLLASGPAPEVSAHAMDDIDCYCTDATGDRRELGELVCLDVGGRRFLARCEMSLNNPMWREVSEGCLGA